MKIFNFARRCFQRIVCVEITHNCLACIRLKKKNQRKILTKRCLIWCLDRQTIQMSSTVMCCCTFNDFPLIGNVFAILYYTILHFFWLYTFHFNFQRDIIEIDAHEMIEKIIKKKIFVSITFFNAIFYVMEIMFFFFCYFSICIIMVICRSSTCHLMFGYSLHILDKCPFHQLQYPLNDRSMQFPISLSIDIFIDALQKRKINKRKETYLFKNIIIYSLNEPFCHMRNR